MLNLMYPPDWLKGHPINPNNVCFISYSPDEDETYFNGIDIDYRRVNARIVFHFEHSTTKWTAKTLGQSDKVEELCNSWNSFDIID